MREISTLKKYSVKLAIYNVNETADPNIVQDLEEEIAMRPHLDQFSISYDASSQRVETVLSIESINEEFAEKQAAEEFFEIANAILNHIQGVKIKVLDISEINA